MRDQIINYTTGLAAFRWHIIAGLAACWLACRIVRWLRDFDASRLADPTPLPNEGGLERLLSAIDHPTHAEADALWDSDEWARLVSATHGADFDLWDAEMGRSV